MAEVTNELMCELLKRVHDRTDRLEDGKGEIRQEPISIRGHMLSIQNDVHTMYGMLGRHDERLDRIERRLDLHELAEPQRPFERP